MTTRCIGGAERSATLVWVMPGVAAGLLTGLPLLLTFGRWGFPGPAGLGLFGRLLGGLLALLCLFLDARSVI